MADDLFPASPRVIYARAPLTEVVCQLRFPPILRIEAGPPADFQDRIRATFPLLERATQQTNLVDGLPADLARLLNVPGAGSSYVFKTEDQKHTITLAPEWLALTTTEYQRWEGFRSLLIPPLQALIEIYKPSFFSRIGLRYQNSIHKPSMELDTHRWAELLIPEVLGALVLPQFESNIMEIRKRIRCRLPDGSGSVFIQHGFGGDGGRDKDTYLLDFDFYADKTEVQHAVSVLDDFHTRAGRAFRWCITPTLHERLGPQQLD
ncbi:MAG: TIGR04255 family protein [Bauldia sp.]|nr:TIGR04255 family protein [Bauldia sp.]MCW5716821.1 TIGR04255 family protein [Bauldia sp.]